MHAPNKVLYIPKSLAPHRRKNLGTKNRAVAGPAGIKQVDGHPTSGLVKGSHRTQERLKGPCTDIYRWVL